MMAISIAKTRSG